MKPKPIKTFGFFQGLPGRARRQRGYHLSSPSMCVRILAAGKIASTAGDNGCVTVYRDTAGQIRCSFCRRMSERNHTKPRTLRGVRRWLNVWLPKMQEGA